MQNTFFSILAIFFASLQISIAQNITVLPDGKVGLGTPTPLERLQIGDRWTFHDGGTKFIGQNVFWNGATDEVIFNGAATQFRFENDQLRMLVASSASAGSNFSAANSLTLSSNRLTANSGIFAERAGRALRMLPNNPGPEIGSSTKLLNFWYTGVGWNYLFAGAYFQVSDQSLKTNIQAIPRALNLITELRGVSYILKDDDERRYGFIAQEVEKVLPEAVAETKDELKGVDYSSIVPILVEAVKEQQLEIDLLRRELETLKKD